MPYIADVTFSVTPSHKFLQDILSINHQFLAIGDYFLMVPLCNITSPNLISITFVFTYSIRSLAIFLKITLA